MSQHESDDETTPRKVRDAMRPSRRGDAAPWRDRAMERVADIDRHEPLDPGVFRRAMSLIACIEALHLPGPAMAAASARGGIEVAFVGHEGRQVAFAIIPGRPIEQMRTLEVSGGYAIAKEPPPRAVPGKGGLVPWVRAAIDWCHPARPREGLPENWGGKS